MVNFKPLRQMIEVKGNGNIISKEISVSSFICLHVAGRGMVELYQSDEEKVIVETDENLHEFISVINSGRTLYVSVEGKLRQPVFTLCKIKIYLRQIDLIFIRNENANLICGNQIAATGPVEIKIQSAGNVELDMNAPAIKILCQSVGDVVLKGKCDNLRVKNQAVGDFNASDLFADRVSIQNSAVGNILLHAEKEITIKHSGVGYIHYSGKAILKDVRQHGVGEIKHVDQ
jgi:phage pi2 protein 07